MDHETCHHLLSSLSEFVDGSLEAELCMEIERHLEGCDNCQVVVDSLRKTIYLYHVTAQETVDMPSSVRQRLFHRLNLDEFLQKNSG
jgi:anti-sigma factor RsiW